MMGQRVCELGNEQAEVMPRYKLSSHVIGFRCCVTVRSQGSSADLLSWSKVVRQQVFDFVDSAEGPPSYESNKHASSMAQT